MSAPLRLPILSLLLLAAACSDAPSAGGGSQASAGGGVDSPTGERYPFVAYLATGRGSPAGGTSTTDVAFDGQTLYTASDCVQAFDAHGGAELEPPGASPGGQPKLQRDRTLHVSPSRGFVGSSHGGQAFAAASPDTPLFAAKGKGYLSIAYAEGLGEFIAYDAEALQFFDAKDGSLRTTQPIKQGITLVVGGSDSYATALPDHRIVLWPTAEGAQGMVLAGHGAKVIDMAYGPSGGQFASIDADGALIVWDLGGGTELFRRELEISRAVPAASLAFVPGARTLAANGKGSEVQFWSTENGELRGVLDVGGSGVVDLAVSPDGKLLALGLPFSGRFDQNRNTASARDGLWRDRLASGPALVFDISDLAAN